MPITSLKYDDAAKRLPTDLKPVFERLVREYEYLTATHYGRGYVAYQVLADLVLGGWRPSEGTRQPLDSALRGKP